MKNVILKIKPLGKPRMTQRHRWLSNPDYKPRNKQEAKRQEILKSIITS